MTNLKASFPIEDVCLALALIRPGASEYGSKETFLRTIYSVLVAAGISLLVRASMMG